MRSLVLRDKTPGRFSIHESPISGSFVLDSSESIVPDGQLRNELCCALAQSTYLALRRLEIDVQNSMVLLRGSVPNYYLKQMSQSLVHKIATDCDIVNLLEVVDSA